MKPDHWALPAPTGDRAAGLLHIYVPHLGTGGGELSLMRLADGLVRLGWQVRFVIHREGPRPKQLDPAIGIDALGASRTLEAVRRLARYLREQRVALLLTAFPHSNAAAVAARALSGQACRLVLTEHAPLAQQVARTGGWRYRLVPTLVRLCYPHADAVVGVSRGVCADLQQRGGGRLQPRLIHNPVLPEGYEALCAAPAPHAWLADPSLEVLISVSRLSAEKDVATIVRAFACLAGSRPALRLVIAGEGPERGALEAQVAAAGLTARVHFAGIVPNAFAWMSRARVLVLASQFEGFGNVLVEALAAGARVVSADCPVGPREILEDGRLGALVPVGDAEAMAAAVAAALDAGPAEPALRAAAARYGQARSAAGYASLFRELVARP